MTLPDWQIKLDFFVRHARLHRAAFAFEEFDQSEAFHAFQRARQVGLRAARQSFQLGERVGLLFDDEIEQQTIFVRQYARKAFNRREPQLSLCNHAPSQGFGI